jgi:hypothetical protein
MGKFLLAGDALLLRDFGPYGKIFMNVCYIRCHGNAVKGFSALCLLYAVLTDFGPCGMIFVTMCVY